MVQDNYVIFVDDEEALHLLFKSALKRTAREKNFNIECFENGLVCLNFLKEEASKINILLIVTDLNMPVMNGFELTEQVKKSFPGIHLVVSSAYGDKETADVARSLGASGFLAKPLDIDLLIEEIDNAMNAPA